MSRMPKIKPKIRRVFCNRCGHDTRHIILKTRVHEEVELDRENRQFLTWRTTYEMLECRGCEDVVLKRFWQMVEDEEIGNVDYFPPPVSRRLPAWKKDLPGEVRDLLKEVYAALNADSRCLATMGARALLDMAIFSTVGDVGSFRRKLNALQARGFVSSRNRKYLESVLEVGGGQRPIVVILLKPRMSATLWI